MKFLLFSVLCIFFSAALGATNLTCLSCSIGDTSCNNTCSSSEVCLALREDNTLEQPNGTYTNCVNQSSQCKAMAFTFSSAPNHQVLSSMACCMTENCNEALILSVPPSSNLENGVYCPASEKVNQTEQEKQTRIACKGAENKCLSFTAYSTIGNKNETTTIEVKGCSTESACSLVEEDFIAFGSKIYKLSTKVNCTDGSTNLATLSSVVLILPAAVSFLMSNLLS